jgi:hypothetical protein
MIVLPTSLSHLRLTTAVYIQQIRILIGQLFHIATVCFQAINFSILAILPNGADTMPSSSEVVRNNHNPAPSPASSSNVGINYFQRERGFTARATGFANFAPAVSCCSSAF